LGEAVLEGSTSAKGGVKQTALQLLVKGGVGLVCFDVGSGLVAGVVGTGHDLAKRLD
jgi:hypothetical protein